MFATEAACVVLQDDFMASPGVFITPGCWQEWQAVQCLSAGCRTRGQVPNRKRETGLRSQEGALAAGQNKR